MAIKYPFIDNNIQEYLFRCPVEHLPKSIPSANPRDQNIDQKIYKNIAKDLLNEQNAINLFCLMNKGITIAASKIHKTKKNKKAPENYHVFFKSHEGIIDGGHTHALIVDNADQLLEDSEINNIKQYVDVKVITGLPKETIVKISQGLNTSLQVKQYSIENQLNSFQPIKDALKNTSFAHKIAYKENQQDATREIREILFIMHFFNYDPNKPRTSYPSNVNAAFNHYLNNQDTYKPYLNILPDMLVLYDLIASDARNIYNKHGGRGATLPFIEKREKKYTFDFLDDHQSNYRLCKAALYPIFAAFRTAVTIKNNKAKWITDPNLLWLKSGFNLMIATKTAYYQSGNKHSRNVNSIRQNKPHWQNLTHIVKNHI